MFPLLLIILVSFLCSPAKGATLPSLGPVSVTNFIFFLNLFSVSSWGYTSLTIS